jgi:UDP-N-acetylbacillosamine N-acetyltransferase
MKDIAILGAGGHCRSVTNIVNKNIYNLLGIFDDNFVKNEIINGIKLVGKIKDIPVNIQRIIAFGDVWKRKYYYNNTILVDNLIHKKTVIEGNTSIGTSNQIFKGVYINSGAIIGWNNILNTNSIIEHEVRIGNHNHISIGAILAGRVTIGSMCFVGAGTVIIDNISICDNVTIGANSVVTNSIYKEGIYVGSPVRKIK